MEVPNKKQQTPVRFLNLEHDLRMICVEAYPYPEGITKAFEKLYSFSDSLSHRTIYGLSYNENGHTRYLAAVEELFAGEAALYGCTTTFIRSGRYAYITLKDYLKDPQAIPHAFALLSGKGQEFSGSPEIECYHSAQEMICLRKENLTNKKISS